MASQALVAVEVDPETDHLTEIWEEVAEGFDATVLPQLAIRALALQARRFVAIPGAQWEGPFGETFENSIKVEINKTLTGMEKIQRDYRDNRIMPDFRPQGADANQDTADTLDGMYRADSYHFKAQQALDNAFDEAIGGGFGAYRLVNDLADPFDTDSDEQRINPGMVIVDADQRVFFDGNSKLYDKSDAQFCFVLTAYTRAAFIKKYGAENATSWPESTLLRWSYYDWYQPDIILVCEYYKVENKTETLLILTHRLTNDEQRIWKLDLETDEIEEMQAQGYLLREVKRKRRRIHKYTLSGEKVLKDNGFIAGERIPVVPVYGKRWFIDNQERFCGYVQSMMDRQRVYNSIISKLAEISALSPREKPIFLSQQMPPHLAELWAEQERARHPYALVEPVIDPTTGQIMSMGPIGKIEPPQLPPVMAALLQIAGNDLIEDQADPDEVVANTSADAMDMAATRVDAKSGLYLDNMRQSVQCGGEIYLSMSKDVYYEAERQVETMTEDGDDGQAVLQEAYTDPKSGRFSIRNDFTRGKYKVIASVTEATATRKDKAVKSNLAIAEIAATVNPELANVALLTAVMNQDGEGSDVTAKYARKQLVAMGAVEPNDEEKQEMEEAAQNAQPDPSQALIQAQTAELTASAEQKAKLAAKAEADTEQSRAKTVLTLAQAEAAGGPETDHLDQIERVADIEHRHAETAHLRAETEHLPHGQMIAAHDADTRRMATHQKIRRGSEF